MSIPATTHSPRPAVPSVAACALSDAIAAMVYRYGHAVSSAAYARSRAHLFPAQLDHLAEALRWERAAQRRQKAIRRLTHALRAMTVGGTR